MNYRLNNRKGFTLLEMLVVCALTAVVLGLVFGPLIESARFTRNAQMMSRAQDGARVAMSQVSHDLSEALFVYDTSGAISFPMSNQDGTWTSIQVRYAKVDMVLPMLQGYCTSPNHPSGSSRAFGRNYTYADPKNPGKTITDPNLVENAPICPFDQSPLELRPVQPLTPDTKIVRYFIGLRDNSPMGSDSKPHYVNPYAPFKMSAISSSDGKSVPKNMYVLYRAEFSPADAKDGTNRLFPSGRGVETNISDEGFFYNSGTNSTGERYCDAWKKISRIVATPDDMDLITVDTNRVYDANGAPLITPTVQFTPTVVSDEILAPTTQNGQKPENSDYIPTVYKAQYGNWTNPYKITVERKTGSIEYYTSTDDTTHELWLWKHDPANPPDVKVFNITEYQTTSQGPDSSGTWTGYQYGFGKIDSGSSAAPELALVPDLQKGTVNFAFPHVDVTVSDGLSSLMGGKSPVSFAVNTKSLNDYYTDPSYLSYPCQGEKRRFIEFNLPTGLNSFYVLPKKQVEASTYQFLKNSTVATGLEKVIGPNANAGQSFGMPMFYGRLPFMDMFGEPGANQYKLDVAHPVTAINTSGLLQPDAVYWNAATSLWTSTPQPNVTGAAAIYFRSEQAESGPSYRLPQYDPSSGDSDLPAPGSGTINGIYVLYFEQNNHQDDVVKASYVTKSVMTVTLGIKLYDNSTGKPYTLQLSNKIKVRNSS